MCLAPELDNYVIPKQKEVIQELVRWDEILDTEGFVKVQERLLSLQCGAVRPWTAHSGHSDLQNSPSSSIKTGDHIQVVVLYVIRSNKGKKINEER